ncbi:MAG: hypothetical protein GXP63_01700 [DPANN group archaeon]|nr:hypothetical protein [DPANN group archaeon]
MRQGRLSGTTLAGMTGIVLMLVVLSTFIAAQPPTPHGIAGTIYLIDGTTQVPLGSPFRVNDSTSGDLVHDVTSVPVPGLSGRYSVSIDGLDGDFVIVQSWNDSHYGETNLTLIGDMTGIDVILNRTREPEANVTIVYPANGASFNTNETWQLNVSYGVLGGQDGIGCNATLTIADTGVFDLATGESAVKELGGVALGETVNISYNISGKSAGTSNFTVNGICSNSRVNFAGESNDTVFGITATGQTIPQVQLIRPANNTLNITTHNITFTYQVSHPSLLNNCTLILDDQVNMTQLAPDTDVEQNFSVLIPNGQYNWTVNCTDILNVSGTADPYNLTVRVYPPAVISLSVDTPIDLQTGTATIVTCNASVRDENGISDLASVNASLFNQGVSSPQDTDNKNWHYTNSSCSAFQTGVFTANYSCTFPVEYYARNGSWACNVTLSDSGNNINSSVQSTTLNALIALSTDAALDFGNVLAGQVSSEMNITITNTGNIGFNISTNGYGLNPKDNLSLACDSGQNISVTRMRYAPQPGVGYGIKTNLTADIALINNIFFPKRTDEAGYGSDRNNTFWAVGVPTGMKVSSCNGTIVLYATIA